MSILTADLYDHFDDELELCELVFRNFGGVVNFSGPIATARVLEDNVKVREHLEAPGQGRVLVVDGQGSSRRALCGDNVAAMGAENGWAGLIINGCIRDAVAMKGIGLGLKALGTCPRKPLKVGEGEIEVPLSFGGVTFRPGEWVYADTDGVVVCPRELHLPETS